MDRKERLSIVEFLRREQANAVELYLQYKGYHWNVSGPLFHDLHTMFDAHAKWVFDTIDELAERQRILDAPAEYTLESLRLASNLEPDEKIPRTPREMVDHLGSSHGRVITDMKKGFELADRLGDPGTADLFARLVQLHEKLEWFLREVLATPTPILEGIGLGPVVSAGRRAVLPTGR